MTADPIDTTNINPHHHILSPSSIDLAPQKAL